MKIQCLRRVALGTVLWLSAGVLSAPCAWAETGLKEYPASAQGLPKLFVGEKLTFSISYFAVPIGRATAEVREMTVVHGRPAYHIVVNVASTSVVDLIYKVRGEHHSYLDAKSLSSLRYEIRSAKDAAKVAFEMNIDPDSGTAEYHYIRRGIRKKVKTPPNSQDRLSMGYYFRTLDLSPHQTLFIPVQTEQQTWQLSVKTAQVKPIKLKNIGIFQALEAVPTVEFISTLKEPGAVRGWISTDERRIPLIIRAKAPLLGSVTVKLTEYVPGRDA